jgi:hypothetical protein
MLHSRSLHKELFVIYKRTVRKSHIQYESPIETKRCTCISIQCKLLVTKELLKDPTEASSQTLPSCFCPSLPEIEFRSYLNVIKPASRVGADKHSYFEVFVFTVRIIYLTTPTIRNKIANGLRYQQKYMEGTCGLRGSLSSVTLLGNRIH